MARKYEFGPGLSAWNLEQCEEVVLIAVYLEILPFIPANETWQTEFENHFFTHGNGIAASFIDQINAARRRKGLDTIDIRESDISDYARAPNKQLKSETRKRFRAELTSASVDERVKRVERAKAEMQILPPPHYTFDQWKARRDQYNGQREASLEEIRRQRTLAAVTAPPPPPPKPKSLPAQTAIKMLTYATKPDTIQSIIDKLSAEDAMEVVAEVANEDIRDELIRHSLKHL